MTDIINEEENSNQIPEEIEDIAVVDNGTTYESTESAIIAKEEADKAKLWAQESERQANLASGSADTAAQARDDAVAAKEYAEAAITDTNLITVATDLQSTPSNIKTVAQNITGINDIAVNLSTVLDAKNQAIAAANSASSALTYENKARNWAIEMDGLVDGEDYSAKYYANQARQAASGAVDNKTITLNANNEHQAIGVINQNTADAVKIWSGTKEEYEDITHSNDTVYLVVGVGIYIGDIQVSAGGGGGEIGDIGIAPLGIDETENKRRYLNGQVISQAQFVSFTDKLKSIVALYPNLATTEVNWQAEVTNSKLGQCGKFVIDDVAGTIRLPKVVNINGLQDLTGLGGIKAESLPNITGSCTSSGWKLGGPVMQGAFYRKNTGGDRPGYSISGGSDWYFDASRSSSTYQDDAPVQQEAVQYPYFIQVATGVETSVDVSREIELNNPFSLFDFRFSDHLLNNVSWLRADTFSWQDGTVYAAAYNHLVDDYTNGTRTLVPEGAGIWCNITPDGHRIVDASDTTQVTNVENLYNESGVAWYYILDTTNQRFKLPRTKYGFVGLRDTVGKFVPESLPIPPDHTHKVDACVNGTWGGGGSNIGRGTVTSSNPTWAASDIYKVGAPVQQRATQMYLYFYVGETVQDANIIAAGQALTDIADLKNASNFSQTGLSTLSGLGMPSDRYEDLTLGASGATYTAPANGYFASKMVTSAANGYLAMSCSATNMASVGQYPNASAGVAAYIPVKKNDIMTFTYAGVALGVAGTYFRFVYAEGEN